MRNDTRSKQNLPPEPERRKEDRDFENRIFASAAVGALMGAGVGLVVGYILGNKT